MNAFKTLLSNLFKRQKSAILILFVCAPLTVISTLLFPLTVGLSLDLILAQAPFERFQTQMLMLLSLSVVAALTRYGNERLSGHLSFWIAKQLRRDIMQRLLYRSFETLEQQKINSVLTLAVQDVEQVADGLILAGTDLITGILSAVGTLILMWICSWPLAIIAGLLTPVSVFLARIIAKQSRKAYRQMAESRQRLTELGDESIRLQALTKSLGAEAEIEGKYDLENTTFMKRAISATFIASLANPISRFSNRLVYAAVATFGFYLAIKGHLSIGILGAFLSYCAEYAKPFNDISNVLSEFQNAQTSLLRIQSFIAESASEPEPKPLSKRRVPRIQFHNVNFSYNEAPFIQNLNLDVQPGQKIAIVGPTGSGKTTLIQLLMRFYDLKKGGIYFDGKNIAEMDLHELRSHFAYVAQESWIREASVRDNISLGRPVTHDQIEKAAHYSHADEFIRQFEAGYNQELNGAKANLSEGQKQLLCLARAFVEDAPILILDEAGSYVDPHTERHIQDALQKLMKGKSAFVIAHRLSTILDADLILVMDHGQLVESGTHQALLARGGLYADIYHAQFQGHSKAAFVRGK